MIHRIGRRHRVFWLLWILWSARHLLSHDDQLSRSFLPAADVQFLKALSQIISRDVVEIMPQHDSRSLCTLCPSFFLHHTYCERRRRRPEFSSLDIDAGALDLLMWFRRIGYITGSAEIFLCCREKKHEFDGEQRALFTVDGKVFSTTTGKTTRNSEELETRRAYTVRPSFLSFVSRQRQNTSSSFSPEALPSCLHLPPIPEPSMRHFYTHTFYFLNFP